MKARLKYRNSFHGSIDFRHPVNLNGPAMADNLYLIWPICMTDWGQLDGEYGR